MTTPGSALLDLHRPAASGSTASAAAASAAAAATATPPPPQAVTNLVAEKQNNNASSEDATLPHEPAAAVAAPAAAAVPAPAPPVSSQAASPTPAHDPTPASKDGAGYDSYVDTGLLAMLEASASAAQDQQVDIPPALSPAATSASGESGAEEVGSAERRAEAHTPPDMDGEPVPDGDDLVLEGALTDDGSSDGFDGDDYDSDDYTVGVDLEEAERQIKENYCGLHHPAGTTTTTAEYCIHDDCVDTSTGPFVSKYELEAHMEVHITSIQEPDEKMDDNGSDIVGSTAFSPAATAEPAPAPPSDAVLREIRTKLAQSSYVPTKKPKFVNFIKHTLKLEDEEAVETLWAEQRVGSRALVHVRRTEMDQPKGGASEARRLKRFTKQQDFFVNALARFLETAGGSMQLSDFFNTFFAKHPGLKKHKPPKATTFLQEHSRIFKMKALAHGQHQISLHVASRAASGKQAAAAAAGGGGGGGVHSAQKLTTNAGVGEGGDDASSPGMPRTHDITNAGGVRLVESEADLRAAIADDPSLRAEETTSDQRDVVAIDCEGVPEELLLLQVATQQYVYVIDCMQIGADVVCTQLKPLLTSTTTIKLFHDLHNDAVAIVNHGSVAVLAGCLDSQLVMEFKTGELHMGFNDMLQQSGKEPHPSKAWMKREMNASSGTSLFSARPLAKDVVEYAALDASLLLGAKAELFDLVDGGSVGMLIQASDQRAQYAVYSGGKRRVCIDCANQYALASRELLESCRPSDMQAIKPLVVSNDVEPLMALLPPDIAASLADKTEKLSDIILDKGRQAQAWCDGERQFIGGTGDAREVSQEDIDGIVVQLGGFGYDNRAGLERQLHRISAIRNRANGIIGLTMRVGRHVEGNVAMIADLLFHDDSSILFLGEPGSGKTTIVREATRLLAEMSNVLVVDTSNEIAGDGDVPHPCVGLARRLQVVSLEDQGAVMIEGVQNHTPEIMVIDEIGRPAEVEAARTCKQRGVRMIASAHGDLRKLIKNKQLRGLIGGVESVTLGDAAGEAAAKKRGAKGGTIDKIQAKRGGAPVFDTIVELRRGEPHEWRIVKGTAKAVDSILEGRQYLTQRRTRNPETGDFYVELEKA